MCKFFLLLLNFFLFYKSFLFAIGISTNFNNIFVENLKIGQEYNLTKLIGIPVKIKNNSNKQVKIKIQPVIPNNLKEGFEVIPSTQWIKFKDYEFTVEPQGYAVTDMIISIPKDDRYLGKKFQVNILSYVSEIYNEKEFLTVTAGIESVFLFSISPVKIKQKVKPISLNFELNPAEIYATVSSTYEFIGSVEIKNNSRKAIKYEISRANTEDINSIHIKEGYEILPEDFVLLFFPDMLRVKKDDSKTFNVFLSVPTNNNYSGKKFFGLIEVKTSSKGILGRKFVKTFIEFK